MLIMKIKIYMILQKLFFLFTNWYVLLSPRKRKVIDLFLLVHRRKIRAYYTIPTNNSIPSDKKKLLSNSTSFDLKINQFIDKNIRDSVNSVAGYIPYIKHQTSLYFYHFFSINYGLRKSLFGQITLINENDEIVQTCVVTFPSRFNGAIDLNEIFGDHEGTSCILEIFHPRLLNNHGGHQGHLRFWGIYGEDFSTVHSMPLFPLIVKNDTPKFAERRFYAKEKNKSSYYYFINSNLKNKSIVKNEFGDLSLNKKMLTGFTIQMENNPNTDVHYPCAIWHHATLCRSKYVALEQGIVSQMVSFPKINNIDAAIFLGELFSINQNITFSIYCTSRYEVIQSRTLNFNSNNQITLSEYFDLSFLMGNILIISPEFNMGNNIYSGGYVNVQYIINDKLCDSVHAHGYSLAKLSQGLKFMHYKIDNITSSYFSIWGCQNEDINYRLKIYDNRNSLEQCFYLTVKKEDIIQQINLKELDIPNGEGIVQLECDTHNPPSTSFIHKKEELRDFLSVCHQTGG